MKFDSCRLNRALFHQEKFMKPVNIHFSFFMSIQCYSSLVYLIRNTKQYRSRNAIEFKKVDHTK